MATLVALLAIPLVLLRQLPPGPRLGLGVVLALAGAGVWLAGLFAANVRIVCRLF